ncbi:MAG: glycosyltransferase [Lachnospiraceae bacterium]|nr:glycosyltransferase [Lachnospiraceae bacterium]
MREPLVSICILTYQHEPYIEDCIKGILAQNYPNMELLFLDDASTDGTWDKIEQYHEVLESRCVRVEWIRHDHNTGNVTKNVNEMLKRCRGTYIKSLAGDDCLCPGYIEKMVAFLEEHEEYVMAYCNEYIISDEWHVGTPPGRESWFRFHRPFASEKVFDRLLLGNYIPAPATMIRKSAYEKYGYYDESIGYEDYDMWLRLSRKESFGFVNEKLVYYRNSATGLSHTDTRQKFIFMYNETVKVLKKHLRYVNQGKRQTIIVRFLTARINEMKKKKWYDLALVFWIKRRRLCRRNTKKIVL